MGRGSFADPAATWLRRPSACMSLINDALIKAERDRAEAAIANAVPLDPLARERKRREQQKRQSLRPIFVNAAMLGAVFAVVIVVVLWQRAPVPPTEPVPSAAVVDRPNPTEIVAAPLPPLPSPPIPEPDDPSPAPSAPEYMLSGMSTLGNDTLLSIVRQSDRRSVWVPVGKSVGEITAVRYDPERDLAVIRVNGRHLTIRMGATSAPAE